MPFIVIALLVTATLGGGTAAAAQASLPGDLLWGFKTHINEGVARALAPSDIAKADLDLGAIQTRLRETTRLSATGRLSEKAQADIAANITSHTAHIKRTIETLRANGETRTAANLAARYQADLAAAADADLPNTNGTYGSLSNLLQAAFADASSLSASVSAADHP